MRKSWIEIPISRVPVVTQADVEADRHLLGLASMAIAGLLFAVMGVGVYAASLAQPPVAAPMVSFIRVAVNLSLLTLSALVSWELPALFGDWRLSLWLRGVFGGVSLILSFAAIQRIGLGESALLSASSGIFVAALGPAVLAQRNSPWAWLAILGALAGLFLLFQPRLGAADYAGRLMGLGSGFLAALAYLMVARAGRSNPPRTVVFYFCLVAVLIHLAYFVWRGESLPEGWKAWGWVLLAGFSGSIAQWVHDPRLSTGPCRPGQRRGLYRTFDECGLRDLAVRQDSGPESPGRLRTGIILRGAAAVSDGAFREELGHGSAGRSAKEPGRRLPAVQRLRLQ